MIRIKLAIDWSQPGWLSICFERYHPFNKWVRAMALLLPEKKQAGGETGGVIYIRKAKTTDEFYLI